jgi:hypothetical protein
VYEIVKAVMDNNQQMLQGHAAASETLPEHAVANSFMAWHPGAARYFTEKGVALPEVTLRPPEA